MEVVFGGVAGAFPCLMFAAVAALIVVGIVYGIMKARERREAMARLAAELGLQHYPDDPWGIPGRYEGFSLFSQGHSRHASNVLAGQIDGRSVMLFDYRYTTGSGKNQSTHCFGAGILQTPITAPKLTLRPESILDSVASWVGYDDIDFESDEFSRRYFVKCEDRKFAYDIFHGQLIDYLLRCGTAPAMEMQGPLLLVYASGSGQAEDYRRLLMIGQTVVNMIPDYVRSARAAAQPPGGQL